MLEEENFYTSMYSRNAELYHHGIQGQKWGVQNGPPYPLDSDISTGKRLKKAGKTLVKDAKENIKNTKIGKIEKWTGPIVSLAVMAINKEARTEYTEAVIAYQNAKESKKHFKTLYKALEQEKYSNIDHIKDVEKIIEAIEKGHESKKLEKQKKESLKKVGIKEYTGPKTSDETYSLFKNAREKMKTYDEERDRYYFETNKLTKADIMKMAKSEFNDYKKYDPYKYSNVNDYLTDNYGDYDGYESDIKEYLTLNG